MPRAWASRHTDLAVTHGKWDRVIELLGQDI